MDQRWAIVDCETSGIADPIYVVEICVQNMDGWAPVGEPFTRLINHSIDISPKSSRIHGYTREILERDGEDPLEVYGELRSYLGDRPLVAYNIEYDWDRALVPEWKRLGIAPIGQRGFCALRLAQRLIDPVPAGNHKLQTLRRYYELPERAAHSADGDVLTLIDLLTTILCPIARERGLESWDDFVVFATEEWFPSRLPFGKFKGRDFRDATADEDFRAWLQWLAQSARERSSVMGRWYLAQLIAAPEAATPVASSSQPAASGAGESVVLWVDANAEKYENLVRSSRDRLADLESEYTSLKLKIDELRARLFEALRPFYEERDSLRLKIRYRQQYIDVLIRQTEEAAEEIKEEFEEAEAEQNQHYEETAESLENKRALTDDEEKKVKKTWKKLVTMFHPDRYQNDEKKREAYQALTATINRARDEGNLLLLEEIAGDPHAYMAREGIRDLDVDVADRTSEELRKTWESLQARILRSLAELEDLQSSEDFDLYRIIEREPAVLDDVIAENRAQLEEEIAALTTEKEALDAEIEELTGIPWGGS